MLHGPPEPPLASLQLNPCFPLCFLLANSRLRQTSKEYILQFSFCFWQREIIYL
ncbi:hypothetical protein Hanom_Chr08g00741421 [Helianthus anomalus]